MVQTNTDIPVEYGTICFLFSTSLSHIGSEIEKRKIARAQSKNKRKNNQKKSLRSEKSSQNVTQNAASLDLVSLIFCLFQPIDHFCLAAKLTLISVCYLCKLVENPVEKHSKALRKPDYIATSLSETICRLAYSGGLMHLHP